MNLSNLQIAILSEDNDQIQSELSAIDRRSENEAFRLAGERFNFKTSETGGRRVAYLPEMARVMGYSDPSGLRKLVERYDLESYSLGGYGQNVRQFLLESLAINKQTGHATFVTWPSFLVAGMVSTAPQATAIKRYLLECEKAARLHGGFINGEQSEREARQDGFRRAATIARIDGMKNQALQRLALSEIGIDPAVLNANQPDLFK